MGYNIYIGNAVLQNTNSDGKLDAYWTVESVVNEAAPAFPGDGLSEKSNGRYPSYSGWKEFCEEAGLKELFFNDEHGLMRDHPGCFLLEEKHCKVVEDAITNRQSVKPPGFNEDNEDKYDCQLARLLWLKWWMRFALDNCETPAIFNC